MPISLKEILEDGVNFIKEFNGFYYIWPIHKDHFDDTMWKVNIETEKIEYMDYTSYLSNDIDDKARIIDLNELLRKAS